MSTIKINQLATSAISLTDFFAKADASGVASKSTIQELSNLLKTVDDTAFKGSIAIADVPSENGWYFASESGTYINCGGLVIDTSNNIAIIIVSGTFDTFNKIDIPVSIAIDAVPTEGSTNAIQSNAVFGIETTLSNKASVINVLGNNLFNINASDVSLGKYINTQGGEANSGSYNITGYIEVINGETYTQSYKHNREFYDENKASIAYYPASNPNYTLTAPSGAVYYRSTVSINDWNDFMYNLGSVELPFEPYEAVKTIDTDTFIPQNQVIGLIGKTFSTVIGENKFNINDTGNNIGYYLNGSGGLSGGGSNTVYNTTNYIPVLSGQTYTLSYRNRLEWYDVDFNALAFTSSGSETVLSPTGAVYARCTVNVDYWVLFQFEEGLNSTIFKAYKEVSVLSPFGVYESQILKDTFDLDESIKEVNLTMPKNIYLLDNYENTVYFKGIIDKQKHNYSVRFGSPFKNYETFSRILNPTSETIGVEIIANNDDFEVIDKKTVNLLIGNQSTDNGTINGVAIGDSYTHSGKYLKKVYDVCPSINFDGLRSTDDISNYPFRYEGRGGWTLQRYFQPFNANESASPFMHHPTYNYYGQTNFWWSTYNTPTVYQYQYFEAKRLEIGFGTSDGIKTNPQVNDLMYFDKDGSNVYKYYNGTSWIDANLTEQDFVFNFAKYRSIWNITQPEIVSVLLGLNDFRIKETIEEVAVLFESWYVQMDTLIASVLADNSNAKIAILIPSSVCGTDTNNEGAFNFKFNRMMWEARKLIINKYDERELESIYLVDTGSAIDPNFGFDIQNKLPFSDYTGSLTRTVVNNTPHPSADGYKQIGVKFSAFIQKIR